MDYEKKYKEALESLKGLLEGISEGNYPITKDDIIEIFPELKESEDEKIRKVLIELVKCNEKSGYKLLNNVPTSSMVAWLEKQDDYHKGFRDGYNSEIHEEKPLKWTKHDELVRKEAISCLKHWKNCIPTTWNEDYKNILMWLENELSVHTEKQSEQKPQGKSALEAINEEKVDNANKVEPKDYNSIDPHFAKPVDKVEPKFKVGDWVVNNNTKIVFLIKSYNNGYYTLEDTNGNTYSPCLPPTKEYYYLWSIEDAKPGDILASKDGNSILIFRHLSLDDDDTFSSYYSLTFSSYYNMQGFDEINWLNTNFVPATKEQRDLLLQKMTEAGYEYDAEKEQLKSIEDEIEIPYGSKDSELQEATYYIPKGFYAEIDDDKVVIKKGEKPTWSEEDESMLFNVINRIEQLDHYWNKPTDEKLIDWFKSIKGRYTWKPSDEQMTQLGKYCPDNTALTALYEQLKKLKEE